MRRFSSALIDIPLDVHMRSPQISHVVNATFAVLQCNEDPDFVLLLIFA